MKCRGGGKQRNLQENPQKRGYEMNFLFSSMFLSPQGGLEGGVVSGSIVESSGLRWFGAKSFIGTWNLHVKGLH